jgi:hypothetical protein
MTRLPLGFPLLGWHLARLLWWTVVFRFLPANAVFDRARRAAWCFGWTMQDVTPEDGAGIWRRVRGMIHRAADVVDRMAPDQPEPAPGVAGFGLRKRAEPRRRAA